MSQISRRQMLGWLMIHDLGRIMEGSGRSITDELSGNFRVGTEENHEVLNPTYPMSQPRNESVTSWTGLQRITAKQSWSTCVRLLSQAARI